MASKASAVLLSPRPQVESRPNSPDAQHRHRPQLSLDLETEPLLPDIRVDRPSTPGLRQRDWLSHPGNGPELEFNDQAPLTPGGSPSFFAESRGGPIPEPSLRSRLHLLITQTSTNALSACFLLFIVTWALSSRTLNALPGLIYGKRRKEIKRPWDQPDKYKEKLVKDPSHYAEACGYRIEHQTIETDDGYYLKVHKVIVPGQEHVVKANGKGGWPVIIQHGLFQTSGSFVTSEERSLAFWLAEHGGYQVYLSNNRAVFDMGHRVLGRSDPRFWGAFSPFTCPPGAEQVPTDYNIRELALFDLPAVIKHVQKETGYDKVAFIGHSQGNATMFCTLARGMKPDIGTSISVFIALAPAVYAGPLTTGFPFNLIKSLDWHTWKRLFGVLDFIPIMRWAYNLMPGYAFGLLGYQMFAFLFDWTDTNWSVSFSCCRAKADVLLGFVDQLHAAGTLTWSTQIKRRKAKMFRFTPSPVSSASIFWWTGLNGFSARGCVLDDKVLQWYDKRFPPLSLFYGGKDYLVLVEPLLERLKNKEKDVQVIRIDKLDSGEHCDAFWHADAVELCYGKMLEDIEKTRDRYPEELGAQ